MKSKFVSILLSLMMVCTMMPGLTFAAFADDGEEESPAVVTVSEPEEDGEITEEDIIDGEYLEDEDDSGKPGELVLIEDPTQEEAFMPEDDGAELQLPPDESEFDEIAETEAVTEANTDEDNDELQITEPENDDDNEEGYELSEDLITEPEEGEEQGGDTGESGEAGGEDLEGGWSGKLLNIPDKVTVGKGNSKAIVLKYSGKALKYAYKIADSGICSAEYGKSGSDTTLVIKGKSSGSTYITLKLKGGLFNLFTLDTINIKVDVPKFSVSSTAFTVPRGGTKKVTFSYSNCSEKIAIRTQTVGASFIGITGGKWSKTSLPLTITGKKIGAAFIKASLINDTTQEVYGSYVISILVDTKPCMSLSKSSVTLTTDDVEWDLFVTPKNMKQDFYYRIKSSNTTSFSASWGYTQNGSRQLVIRGNSAGYGTIEVSVSYSLLGDAVASATIPVTVYDNPKLTLSSSSATITAGKSTDITAKASGITGYYCFSYALSANGAKVSAALNRNNKVATFNVMGLNAGKEDLVVYLKDSSGTIRTSAKVSITVKNPLNPKVKLSRTDLDLITGVTSRITTTLTDMPEERKNATVTNSAPSVCRADVTWDSKQSPAIVVTALKPGTSNMVFRITGEDGRVIVSAGFTVKVTNANMINKTSYYFSNHDITQKLGAASMKICNYMFAGEHARIVYNGFKNSKGNCYGMSATVGMMYANNDIYPSSFNSNKSVIKELHWTDKKNSWGLTLGGWIQAMQISQAADIISCHYGLSTDTVVERIRNDLKSGHVPLVNFEWKNGKKDKNGKDEYSGHTVLAIGFENVDSTHDRILIYENNRPLKTQYIKLTKSSSGVYTNWEYSVKYNNITLNSDTSKFGYNTYNEYYALWTSHDFVHNTGTLNQDMFETNIASVSSDDFVVRDVEDNTIAKVENGVLTEGDDDIVVKKIVGTTEYDDDSSLCFIYLPVDVYSFENLEAGEGLSVGIANLDLSAYVETTGKEVTLCAEDDSDFVSAMLNATEGEEYTITLGSSRLGEPEEITYEGVGTGEVVSLMSQGGSIEAGGLESADVSIGEVNDGNQTGHVYSIITTAGEGGNINPGGIDKVWEGEDQEYIITPDQGFCVADVQVDGKSIGAVDSYTFRNVRNSHSISVTFKECEDISGAAISGIGAKVYNDNEQTQNMTVSLNGRTLKNGIDYRADYSDHKNVGTAKVVITGIGNYSGTITKTFDINPKGTSLGKLTGAKKAITVKWKKQAAKMSASTITGYQIQYSLKSNFKKSKSVTVKGFSKTSKKISKLKAGKKYYVRIRTYKTVGGKTYYSAWSGKKKIKTKK